MKKILYFISIIMAINSYSCNDDNNALGTWEGETIIQAIPKSQVKIIVHRGYHKELGADDKTVTNITTENSMASLKGALALDVYGSEFDILATSDDVLVIHHDAKINGTIDIQNVTYDEIKDIELTNGEKLPLLANFLTEGAKQSKVKLILEIKNHYTATRDAEVAELVLNEVKRLNAENIVEYISFSKATCDKLIMLDPNAKVSLLSYDGISGRPILTPKELKALGYYGLDYNTTQMNKNKQWIAQAKEQGIAVNTWTVNWKSLMLQMIKLKVDFVTTDYPKYMQNVIDEYNSDKE